jgi:hypothetical protein
MGESVATPIPVCCLGQGEHHCLGQMLGGEPGSQGLSAASKCPYSPVALAAMHGPDLAPPVRTQALLATLESTPIVLSSKHSAVSSELASRPERGPPAFPLN